MLKRNNIGLLCHMAVAPDKETEPQFHWLLELTKVYYIQISQELYELDVLTRRLIHSSNPQ